MSLGDLGVRMEVSAQTVQSLERNEAAGRVRLDSLRRAAAALDCTLVYAFVPNSSLEATVQAQAARVLDREAVAAEHTMALEAQAARLSPGSRQAMIDKLVESGRVWHRP